MNEKEFSTIAKRIAMGSYLSGSIEYDYDTFMNHGYDETEEEYYTRFETEIENDEYVPEWQPIVLWEPFEYWSTEDIASEIHGLYLNIMHSFEDAYIKET